jgi:predicted anti-sigma-YlaC factor YlaD
MTCHDHQELFSDHLEGSLDAAAARRLEAHLARCAGCRHLHAELSTLLGELPLCATPLPPGLGRRLAARARLPRREASWVAWRRAATWALVFVGAWWQLAGGAVTTFAAEKLVPAASSAVAEVQETAARRAARGEGVVGRAGRMGDSLTSLRRAVDAALLGGEPERAAPAPSAASEPQPSSVPSSGSRGSRPEENRP